MVAEARVGGDGAGPALTVLPWWNVSQANAGSPHEVARGLDVHDVNYLTSQRRTNPRQGGERSPSRAAIRNAALFVGRWVRSFGAGSARLPAGALHQRILMGVASHNQRRVADVLLANDDPSLTALVPVALVTKPIGLVTRFPLPSAYSAALRHVPETIARARTAGGHHRGAWLEHGTEYALTPGLYVAARRWLATVRPAVVLVANDHVMRTRVLLLAARDEGIPTAYVQHASVTSRFPRLSVDVAFLDGRDALEKYLGVGPTRTRVFLTGSPLHDGLVAEREQRPASARLGICLNPLDDPTQVRALVRALVERGEGAIEVRAHPRDERPWRSWLPESAVESVRSAREEPIERFFDRVGVVLAGDSNVHLEAALYGRSSLYLRSVGAGTDAYGFVRSGLVPELRDPSHVPPALAAIRGARPPEAALRRYDATVGTVWAGRSGRLVREVLSAIAQRVAAPPPPFDHGVQVGNACVYALRGTDLEGLAVSADTPAATPTVRV